MGYGGSHGPSCELRESPAGRAPSPRACSVAAVAPLACSRCLESANEAVTHHVAHILVLRAGHLVARCEESLLFLVRDTTVPLDLVAHTNPDSKLVKGARFQQWWILPHAPVDCGAQGAEDTVQGLLD
jgi:hypothetical protein